MTTRNRTKGQTMIYKAQKTNDRATRTTLKWGGGTHVLHMVSSPCSMSYYSYYKTSDKSWRKKGSDC